MYELYYHNGIKQAHYKQAGNGFELTALVDIHSGNDMVYFIGRADKEMIEGKIRRRFEARGF